MYALKFSETIRPAGSNMYRINVSLNGEPFGQLWTFYVRGEIHGWHAKTLDGRSTVFHSATKAVSLRRAKGWMEEKAKAMTMENA